MIGQFVVSEFPNTVSLFQTFEPGEPATPSKGVILYDPPLESYTWLTSTKVGKVRVLEQSTAL